MTDKKLWDEYVALEKERDALRAELDELQESEEGWRKQAKQYMQHALDYQSQLDALLEWKQLAKEYKAELDALKRNNSYSPMCGSGTVPSVPDGWRRATEASPAEGELVICCYVGVYGPRIVTYSRGHYGCADEPDGKGSQPATHWMPLPTVPKPGEPT